MASTIVTAPSSGNGSTAVTATGHEREGIGNASVEAVGMPASKTASSIAYKEGESCTPTKKGDTSFYTCSGFCKASGGGGKRGLLFMSTSESCPIKLLLTIISHHFMSWAVCCWPFDALSWSCWCSRVPLPHIFGFRRASWLNFIARYASAPRAIFVQRLLKVEKQLL